MITTVYLTGLPGVKRKKVRAMFFGRGSVSQYLRLMPGGKTKTFCSAGPRGAVNVYLDDDGNWRCNFCRYASVLSDVVCKTKKAVREWLTKWLPEQG